MNWKRLFFTILFQGVFVFSLYSQNIDRGPYLQSVTTESIIVKWRTDSSTDSKIWYGDSPGNLNLTVSSGTSVTDHELLIEGLSTNSTYYYAVGNNNGQMAGGDANHYFNTTPDTTGSQVLRAWILGDCGTANDNQRDVRDAYYNFIGNEHTDAILLLGDNAYSDGTQSEYQMALFENMYEEKLINSVLWPSFGNHDGHSSLSVTQTGPYYEIFTVPKNGEAGGEASNTEAYYSFDYGNVHFICINSDDIDADPNGDMVQWIETDINATNQEWIVAFFHHPPYTGEGGNESDIKVSSTEMRENVVPVLEAGGVDLVLSGHTHAYQRSYLIRGHHNDSPTWDPDSMGVDLGDGRIDGDGAYYKERGDEGIGTVYIVAGSSGKLDFDDYNYPAMFHSVEKLGSVALNVDGLQMDIRFVDSDGIMQDSFTIIKMVDPPTVNITYPADQEYFLTPENITITADASDVNGSVTQVEFFIDNVSIGTDLNEPYSVNWNIPTEGCFKIKAVATDNEGYFRSSIVDICVGELETCSRVKHSDDDAEEKSDGSMSLTSGDLELVNDGSDQIIGIRFQNLNIPQCAEINNAFIQFTVDDAENINPCNLSIYAEAVDDADAFSSSDGDLTDRERTAASVDWNPAEWVNIGDAGPAQQTIDISSVIQEVANRPGFTINSSIVIIIDGVGKRVAESFDGDASAAPEICIQYKPFGPDEDNDGVCDALDQCPGGPEPGMSCDDGDPNTENDIVNPNCECIGEVIYDCPNLMANIGDSCDDGNAMTYNDLITSNCECLGTLYDCPSFPANIGDACDDGDPNTMDDIVTPNCECVGESIFDCPNLMANFGDPCDDGNAMTYNDLITPNCECLGTLYDCPSFPANIGDACDDGDPNTMNDIITSNCECVGQINFDCPSLMANIGDSCNDGNPLTYDDIITENCDCNGTPFDCPSFPANFGDSCDDGDPNTENDIISANCECVGESTFDCPNLMANFSDPCDDGNALTYNDLITLNCDCNGTLYDCPSFPANIGDSCDDGDPNTENDIVNTNCECIGEIIYDCPNLMANFGDPCDDGDPNTENDIVNTNCECIGEIIYDCPNLMANFGDSCDDGDPNTENDIVNTNCECIGEIIYDCPNLMANFGDPCDDDDPNTENDIVTSNCECEGESIFDCPGIMANFGDSCDDGNALTYNDLITLNCDCNGTLYDCPSFPANIGDSCDDGNPNTMNDLIDADCDCAGSLSISVGVNQSSDDAEEFDGIVNTTSTDLEMIIDGNMEQIIGLRFTNLNINQGSIIDSAYIQFTADEINNMSPCLLEIFGIASDNAATFTTDFQNISNRTKTSSSIVWTPEEWDIVDETEAKQRTVDITSIVQEIVNRSGFDSNSSLAFIIEGEGKRTATSYDGNPLKAPQINILFKNATVGLKELSKEKSSLFIYPVPTKDQINVSFSCVRSQDLSIQILDLKGRLLLSETRSISSGQNDLLFENLALKSGMYFIQLQYDGVVNTAKFIIMK